MTQSTTARLLMRLGVCGSMQTARRTVLIACAALIAVAAVVAIYAQAQSTSPAEFTQRFEGVDQTRYR